MTRSLVIAMAAASYVAYTTVGFDFEAESPLGFEVVYYRLHWDDGATWVGRAVQPVPRPDHAPDWFDPGGTLLDHPSRPAHPRWGNRWGFWWITRPEEDPYVALRYPGATASSWIALPSWLVIVTVGAAGWAGAARRFESGRRRRQRRAGDQP